MEPDPWQVDYLRSTEDTILLCSRQSGKSTTTAFLAGHDAIYNAGSLTLLLSPSLRQSSELFRKVMASYNAAGRPVPTKQESALQLELTNGSRIVSLPGKEETIRGYSGVDLLIADEASRIPDIMGGIRKRKAPIAKVLNRNAILSAVINSELSAARSIL